MFPSPTNQGPSLSPRGEVPTSSSVQGFLLKFRQRSLLPCRSRNGVVPLPKPGGEHPEVFVFPDKLPRPLRGDDVTFTPVSKPSGISGASQVPPPPGCPLEWCPYPDPEGRDGSLSGTREVWKSMGLAWGRGAGSRWSHTTPQDTRVLVLETVLCQRDERSCPETKSRSP